MPEFLHKLFSSDFMGHGYCYLWRPEILWLHAISDGLIAFSYYFIPVMLVYLVRKRKDLPFHWVFFMFGVFILSCGTTHAMEIWTLWHGTYRLAGLIKAITAGASLATAVALVPMVPKALLLPSPGQLRAANVELEKEIAERRRVEEALEEQRNFIAAVLNTVDTLIIVLDLEGRIVQCNRACEQISGYRMEELVGKHLWDLFAVPEEDERVRNMVEQMQSGWLPGTLEIYWSSRNGGMPLISWSTTILKDASGNTRNIIAAGVDVTESKRLEKAILDISAREQARIGQDLHDGLGQHLTGVAFMSKVLEQKLADQSQAEAADAAKIVQLVNQAINKTRELSRGLLPVRSDAPGLMSALDQWSGEVQDLFGIACRFTCEEPILIHDENLATHLYRIAQEAVNNAIKHGRPKHINISLMKLGEGLSMIVRDDGVGLPEDAGGKGGMGLRIMNYRAKMIGGTLQVKRGPTGGTVVTCHLQSGIG
jgi:PAS domain S-box-containing protein